MFRIKLNAGALQLTIFITVIISLLLSAFVLFMSVQKRFNAQTSAISQTIMAANTAMDYALTHRLIANDTTVVSISDNNYNTLKVHREFWGLFEKIIATSKIKTTQFKKIALLGTLIDDRTALYLQDNNKPLVLVGNTKIEGTSFVPKQGVKSGNIAGNSYYGSKFIYGQTQTSSKLPQLQNEILNYLRQIDDVGSSKPQEHFISINNGAKSVYSNSFLNPTQIVSSNTLLVLSNVSVSGNIIIQSKTKISVTNTAKLNDVILIAPEINIGKAVKGTFQAIASKKITVQKNCVLSYPSALVLTGQTSAQSNDTILEEERVNRIELEANTTVKGVIAFLGIQPKKNTPQIQIKTNATIFGEVYCTGSTELSGVVFGSMFSSNVISKQFGSTYINHMYNATIISKGLSQNYVGLPFSKSKKGIAKWLY